MQRNAFFPGLWCMTVAGFTFALALSMAHPVLAQGSVHIVQQGDTLSSIAQQYGTDIETLRRVNNVENEDLIFYGLALKLPDSHGHEGAESLPSVTVTNAQEVVADRSDEAPGATIIHVVRSGEHLGILADRYGVPEHTIARANNLSDADIILPGQRLVIPGIVHTSENVTNRDVLSAMESGAEVGENLRPPLSEIYHQHTDYPTKTEKWIDVDLSEQRVVAYSGMTQVKSFIVSTGLAGTPTVQGEFRIWTKTPVQDLYGGNRAAGDFYYLEDVPWVQYFYEDYAFHGAYWHDHFGQPMSRGCVNMRNEDARWLYEWAGPSSEPDDNGWVFSSGGDPGTLVLVHE